MNHRPTPPRRIPVEFCVKCSSGLPRPLLRQLRSAESGGALYQCTNQAACRKRQRQRATTPPTKETPA